MDILLEKMTNRNFYSNTNFDAQKGKEAYLNLMKHHGFPILERYSGDDLWAIDFGLNDFENVGMGGVFWVNENHEGGGYLGHEIFLLPGQMIVEHSHVHTKQCPPKRESWLVRHGSVYSFSYQKEATGFPAGVQIPESQREIATVNSCKEIKTGELDTLSKACTKHFMMAGPEGAIVTEFATFHDNDGLRFTNKNVVF
ncbi:MAG: hypothetical protein HQL32_05245 [Planctomycetes bacterium]|nr:hypothetical protein [Planctomycetota bacterium]